MHLFSLFCFNCKSNSPIVEMWKNGTMVTVMQSCKQCKIGFKWRSQPFTLGHHPAGNILLSFSTFCSGASISKTIQIFKHFGLSVYSIRTFFLHQRKFLFPAVLKHWETNQKELLAIERSSNNLAWPGDGRLDSMGHSAKFCVYSMFSQSIMKIVHFELLQVCKQFDL